MKPRKQKKAFDRSQVERLVELYQTPLGLVEVANQMFCSVATVRKYLLEEEQLRTARNMGWMPVPLAEARVKLLRPVGVTLCDQGMNTTDYQCRLRRQWHREAERIWDLYWGRTGGELMSMPEVARKLGMHIQTVRRRVEWSGMPVRSTTEASRLAAPKRKVSPEGRKVFQELGRRNLPLAHAGSRRKLQERRIREASRLDASASDQLAA